MAICLPAIVAPGLLGYSNLAIAAPSNVHVQDIRFETTRFDNVHEGYQAIRWTAIDAPVRYEVLDGNGMSYYVGTQAEAFISGLPDGEHVFYVHAYASEPLAENQQTRAAEKELTRADVLVASSRQPVVIRVTHWPMSQAWALLGVGGIVFVVMISMIVVGEVRSRAEASRSTIDPRPAAS